MKQDQIKKLVSFFYEVGSLRRVLRAHQQTLMVHDPSDNIASHSLRTTMIGYLLAKQLKADVNKVTIMCLIHDFEETRCGDQNWVNKKYVKTFEDEIREEQFKNIPGVEGLLKLSAEYQQRQTLEAKIAKDADLLDEILLLKEYECQGNKEAASWLKISSGEKTQQEKLIYTELAKKIAKEIKKQTVDLWWQSLWRAQRRK